MKFTHTNSSTNDTVEIKAKFWYPHGKKGNTTECTVLAGRINSPDNEKVVLGTSKTRRYSKDTPNLVIARTVALFKALLFCYSKDEALEIVKKSGMRHCANYVESNFDSIVWYNGLMK